MNKEDYLNFNVLNQLNISEIEYFRFGIKCALIDNGHEATSISIAYDGENLDETFYNEKVSIGENKPNWSQVSASIQEVKDFWNSKSYARARLYPSISEQLDMMYHDQVDGTTTWKDAIAQVKADNPKSE